MEQGPACRKREGSRKTEEAQVSGFLFRLLSRKRKRRLSSPEKQSGYRQKLHQQRKEIGRLQTEALSAVHRGEGLPG